MILQTEKSEFSQPFKGKGDKMKHCGIKKTAALLLTVALVGALFAFSAGARGFGLPIAEGRSGSAGRDASDVSDGSDMGDGMGGGLVGSDSGIGAETTDGQTSHIGESGSMGTDDIMESTSDTRGETMTEKPATDTGGAESGSASDNAKGTNVMSIVIAIVIAVAIIILIIALIPKSDKGKKE